MRRLLTRIRVLVRDARERLRALFRKSEVEAELDVEIRFHLEKEIERNLAAGMDPGEARRTARMSFGGVESVKERHRDARGTRLLEDLLQDLRFALRSFCREPGFSSTVVLTLALGLGANIAIFALVQGVLLDPLPFREPERLVEIIYRSQESGGWSPWLSVPDFFDLRERSETMSGLAAADWPLSFNLTGSGTPERVRGARVTTGYFDLLGVEVARGRPFGPAAGAGGGVARAVIGHGLWERRFGGRPEAVGSTILVNGDPHTIVGVLPSGIEMPTPAEVWTPLGVNPADFSRRLNMLRVVGRLAPGVGVQAARAEAAAIGRRLGEEYPETNEELIFDLETLRQGIVGDVQTTLWSFMAAVAMLLLLACTNVANLVKARSLARRREIDVRAVLGAARSRLVRQLLTESLVLAVASGLLGLILGRWGLAFAKTMAPRGVPRLESVTIDAPVALFGVILALATGFVFGLWPARSITRDDPMPSIQRGVGGVDRGGEAGSPDGSRGLLVVAQVAVSAVLLVGAGLLVRSYAAMQAVDGGFRTEGILRARVSLPDERYPEDEEVLSFYDRVLERIRALPDVRSAAATSAAPLGGGARSTGYHLVGGPSTGETAQFRAVTPGYFRTMGIPLEAGRTIEQRDDRRAAEVVVVNAAFARREWPGEDPVGRRLSLRGPDGPWATVVGVVSDVRHFGFDREPMPTLYSPHAQRAWDSMDLVVAGDDPEGLVAAVREQVLAVDSDQPIYAVATMDALVAEATADRRFTMLVFLLFAVAAVGLAAIGNYGVVSYRVRRRTREIGVRMALGASRGGVAGLLLREELVRVGVGLVAGMAGAVALSRWMGSLLYSVAPDDPATFAVVAALLIVLSTLAILIPARRAARLDPAAALRE